MQPARIAPGVRLAPDLHLVFATATGRDEVVAVDAATLTVLRRSPTGRFPYGLAYDPEPGLVAVSNKDAGTETVVDARSGAVRRTVTINREVGNVVYDPVGRRMVVPPPANSATGSSSPAETAPTAWPSTHRSIRRPIRWPSTPHAPAVLPAGEHRRAARPPGHAAVKYRR